MYRFPCMVILQAYEESSQMQLDLLKAAGTSCREDISRVLSIDYDTDFFPLQVVPWGRPASHFVNFAQPSSGKDFRKIHKIRFGLRTGFISRLVVFFYKGLAPKLFVGGFVSESFCPN